MPWLKFYEKEHELFKEAYTIKVPDNVAVKIVKKLLRHFQIGSPWYIKHFHIKFWGNRQNGNAGDGWGVDMRLPHNPSLALIIHECAHKFIEHKIGREKGERAHTKKLMSIIARMQRYAKKKGWLSATTV